MARKRFEKPERCWLGGHSVVDEEPKYGLAAFGVIHPQQILAKEGAKNGDSLVLTKALGTGIITTAAKFDACSPEALDAAVSSMRRLNATASQLANQYQANAMTDITGYGLVGHALEMLRNEKVDFHFQLANLPWLPNAEMYAEEGYLPGGIDRNRDYYGHKVHLTKQILPMYHDLIYDPQTSGGLLISIASCKSGGISAGDG